MTFQSWLTARISWKVSALRVLLDLEGPFSPLLQGISTRVMSALANQKASASMQFQKEDQNNES